jgi:hypothetical protein
MSDRYGIDECMICGEIVTDYDEDIAEMYDPENPGEDNTICHYECGRAKNLMIA